MDSATEDIYLQKLEEFVYDEEKVVTSRWLSCNLNINIQDSKHLLEKYVSDAADINNKQMMITHVLSGIASDGTLHITIVKDDEVNEKRAEFSQVLDQQIYSVQKCNEVDLNILSMVDCFEIHNPKDKPIAGTVISKQCIKRIVKFKKLAQLPSTAKPLVQSKPTSHPTSNPIVDRVSSQTGSTSSSKEQKNKSKQSNGFTSFFNKNPSKSIVKPISEPVSMKSEPAIEKALVTNSFNDLIDSESDTEEVSVKPQSVPKSTEKKKHSSKKRSKKNSIKAPSPKRRKRIVEQDSDSDDMFGSDTKEENKETVIDHSDEEEIAKPKVNVLAPKNKKRKLVDRTYEGADGYIVTSKEWIEESPSEDEVIPETPQKEIKKEPKKKESQTEQKSNNKDKKFTKSESSDFSDTNNKDTKTTNGRVKGGKKGNKPLAANQPTLMNFFKRV